MNHVEITVIVPTYNAEKYIKRFYAYMHAQTFVNWSLIIVDDISIDKTVYYAKKYEQTDNRVHVIVRDREPKGSVTCRNIGLEHVVSKYVIQLDIDDTFSINMLKNRIQFMKDNPEVDYATFFGCSVAVKKNGELVYTGKDWGMPKEGEDIVNFLKTDYPYSVWNNIYKTDKIRPLPWDEAVKIYTDFSYIIPLICEGLVHKYALNREPDYYYHTGVKNSMCKTYITEEKYKSTKYLFEKTIGEINGDEKLKICFFKFFLLEFMRILDTDNKSQEHDFILFSRRFYSEKDIKLMKKKGDKYIKLKIKIQKNPQLSFFYSILIRELLDPLYLWKLIKSRVRRKKYINIVKVDYD